MSSIQKSPIRKKSELKSPSKLLKNSKSTKISKGTQNSKSKKEKRDISSPTPINQNQGQQVAIQPISTTGYTTLGMLDLMADVYTKVCHQIFIILPLLFFHDDKLGMGILFEGFISSTC